MSAPPSLPDALSRFAVAGPFDAPERAVALVVEGEVDVATAPELGRRLLAAEASAARVVVDLRAVGFMDSTGLSALLASRERHRERGASGPGLVVDAGHVRRVLELTGCGDMIEDPAVLG